ncbi:NAD-dependent epimerase/dehydratase family protein [Deinococcus sp. Arct2-2]|uniref:SDR family oxidoreductase n=1 Tax=Deinococcus sp. Arct2-2 TaxID=2568653 RepID=UPI0010A3520F|nr:NAD(P)H-binding protein [Deinococcus sp. Arct2-2]THF68922.1 NAD-dependent epimerase/dehydratase family protein [Deinococcus sp. Arct2-2]
MTSIQAPFLVTGGTGQLGRPLVAELLWQGAEVRVLTRRPPAAAPPAGLTYVVGDLVAGADLAGALRGVGTVIHAAHDPSNPVQDVTATRNLLQACRDSATPPAVLYVSIVGAAQATAFSYYAGKVRGEALVQSSGLPHLIFRATQFQEFVAEILTGLTRWPLVLLLPGQLQPVAVADVAAVLADHALRGARGEAVLAGPEVLTLHALTRTWLAARNQRKLLLPLPFMPPHPFLQAVGRGVLTAPQAAYRGRTWADFLRESNR